MAFLLPENIASRSRVPSRLQHVARAFRDFTGEDVVVWLREPVDQACYLVVLDPTAGIMVVDAPPLSARRRPHLGQVFKSLNLINMRDDIIKSSAILKDDVNLTAINRLDVKCVLAVPDLDEVPSRLLPRETPPLEILARSDLAQDRLDAAISRIFGGRADQPLSRPEQDMARAVVNPEIVLPQARASHLPLFQDPEIAPDEVIKVMDREQERVAEHLGFGYRVLRGPAGSGKTLVLAHRARYLRRHWPQWRILMLCYNRVLASSLAETVHSEENLTVTNVDRLAYRLTNSGSRRNTDFDQRVEHAKQAAKKLPDSQRYDVVLVDEAQDFDHARLDLAYAMLKSDRLRPDPQKPDSDNFVTALDAAQNVYRRGGARWNPPGVDAQGRARTARGRTTLFRKNYRNTREILEFAMTFLAGSSDWADASVDIDDPAALVPPEAAKRSGPPPKVVECSDLRAEADEIAAATQTLIAGGVSVADIVVMYGHRDLKDHLCRSFAQGGLPYFDVQSRGRRGGDDGRDRAPSVDDAVRVSTLTSMKGLEFSRVFVGAVNSVEVPDVEDGDQFLAAKSQLYAAMTRAMDELVVTVSGDGEIGRALRAAKGIR